MALAPVGHGTGGRLESFTGKITVRVAARSDSA
jgi:hypothetical protein